MDSLQGALCLELGRIDRECDRWYSSFSRDRHTHALLSEKIRIRERSGSSSKHKRRKLLTTDAAKIEALSQYFDFLGNFWGEEGPNIIELPKINAMKIQVFLLGIFSFSKSDFKIEQILISRESAERDPGIRDLEKQIARLGNREKCQ